MLTVTQAISVEGALQALLIEPGGVYSQTITMTKTGAGAYRGDLSFDFTHSAREGYLYVWGSSGAGERLETMTTYRIAGAPGSHEWAYPTTDLGSLDGLLRLNIPGHVPTTTLIIVMPVYQLEPLGSSAAAWACRLAPDIRSKVRACGTDPRTLVGPAHSIRVLPVGQRCCRRTQH